MGPQIVLHFAMPQGHFACHAFVTQHAVHPLQIVIVPGDAAAAGEVQRLGEILCAELTLLCGETLQPAPCGGICPHPTQCAFQMGGRLLVLIGSGTAGMTLPSWAMNGAWNYLSALPSTARVRTGTLLPAILSTQVAAFWESSSQEVVPSILATTGLTWERPRIFISYKRDETQGLANQLFHGLAEAQFDVFLDHFRLAPGMGLICRIRHELGDKTMMVALESANLHGSPWALYEILVARILRLGLLALALPGGHPVSVIGPDRRQHVAEADFTRGKLTRRAILRKSVLKTVIAKIRTQHDRAAITRRQQVTGSLQSALLLQGVQSQHFDSHGRLHAQSSSSPNRRYVVSVASRPPRLADFHRANDAISSPPAVLIGIERSLERLRREQITWLKGVANTVVYDEGKIVQAAADIAAGTI